MLFTQRIENTKLTPNESIVADYLLKQQTKIANMSTRDIAQATYTSSSTVIRLAKKLGYVGFDELKKDYLAEIEYLSSHFQNVDANMPFSKDDQLMDVAGKMAGLMKETIMDTQSLFQHDSLQLASRYLVQANTIYVYATENLLSLASLFKYKMIRIGKKIELESIYGNQFYSMYLATPKDCALFISYSGESYRVVDMAVRLKEMGIKVIALTSLGDNSLRKVADVSLDLSTREKLHSKIANFTSEYSILLWLNILYACVYVHDYEKITNLKIKRTKEIERARYSSSAIIAEDDYGLPNDK